MAFLISFTPTVNMVISQNQYPFKLQKTTSTIKPHSTSKPKNKNFFTKRIKKDKLTSKIQVESLILSILQYDAFLQIKSKVKKGNIKLLKILLFSFCYFAPTVNMVNLQNHYPFKLFFKKRHAHQTIL